MRSASKIAVVLAALLVFVGGAAVTDAAPRQPGVTATLAAIQTGQHPGFDRIVFEFSSGAPAPSVAVAYVDPPLMHQPSGEPMTVEGSAFLQIRMQPASRFDPVTGAPIAPIRPTMVAGGANVIEVAAQEDFEGTLVYIAGVHTQTTPQTSTLDDPPRVVVDVPVAAPSTPAPPAVHETPNFTG